MTARQIAPSALRGRVTPPPSKSVLHRMALCAALAGGVSTIRGYAPCDDLTATLNALTAMGATVTHEHDTLTVDTSAGFRTDAGIIDCLESGSTLRFLLPVLGALGITATLTGQGRLPARPLGIYRELLPAHGRSLTKTGDWELPLSVGGQLRPGHFELPGNVSSQFITGLLLALPLLAAEPAAGESTIVLTSPLESAPYVDMTIAVMRAFGVGVIQREGLYRLAAPNHYQSGNHTAEADWSAAAFWLAAGALCGDITLHGLNPASHQGDKEVIDVFRQFGADITLQNDTVYIKQSNLHGIDLDAADIPDMVPAVCAAAAFAQGQTHIRSAARLRLKESDRLAGCAQNLRLLGCPVEETADSLTITGIPRSAARPAALNGCADHRMVMAFAVALAAGAGGSITDPESAAKSYPAFWQDFTHLGGVSTPQIS